MWHMKSPSAWIPAIVGTALIVSAARINTLTLIFAILPGVLMVGGGLRLLLNYDLRGAQHAALGAMLGIFLAIPVAILGHSSTGLLMMALSLVAFIAGGWQQIRLQPSLAGVPSPQPSLGYAARVALDDGFLAFMSWLAPLPTPEELAEAITENDQAFEWLSEHNFLENLVGFHKQPPPLEQVELEQLKLKGYDCEYLQFESGFEAEPALPGSDRWMSYTDNTTNHVLLLRRNEPAPWLVCVHGFGMGANMAQDFSIFRAGKIFDKAGVNVAMFTLPVHGPRSPGGFNGSKFMALSPVDFVHAESQAIWDLRRLIGWIRSQGATQVGVYGISLGGYTSALLSCIEDDLACVITGVPPSDVIALQEHLATSVERRLNNAAGLDLEHYRRVQSVVSPLRMESKVPHDNRFMYASTGDQFVPIEQIQALWQHWGSPKISWCTGGHVSALKQRAAADLVDEALASTFQTS